jgi:thiamine kinase-like enzyme
VDAAVQIERKLQSPTVPLDEGLSESVLRSVMADAWPWRSAHPDRLLHGDYWPGNTLWRDGQLVAVIDWEDAAMGDPLLDVANMRLELLWFYESDAMDEFTTAYERRMPDLDYTYRFHWDLWSALRPTGRLEAWGLTADEIARLQPLHRAFVRQALESLDFQ